MCTFIGINKSSIKLSHKTYHPKKKSRPLKAALVLATVWYLGNIQRVDTVMPISPIWESYKNKIQIILSNKIYYKTFLFWKLLLQYYEPSFFPTKNKYWSTIDYLFFPLEGLG